MPSSRKPVLPSSSLPTRLGKVLPPLSSPASPRATSSMPSVAMKGATLKRVMMKPLMAPMSVAAARAMTITIQVCG